MFSNVDRVFFKHVQRDEASTLRLPSIAVKSSGTQTQLEAGYLRHGEISFKVK